MFYLLFLLLITGSYSIKEDLLRDKLFLNYTKETRPVLDSSENIILRYGLEINDMVYFDQKSENIELSMTNVLSWKDNYLTWNLTDRSPKYITAYLDSIWQPDFELYNAAAKPNVFEKTPVVKIYNDGTIEYIRHLTYSFSCKLDLSGFPYDTQTCRMLFGSWKYPKHILDLVPFSNNTFKNFTVNPSFSHNEWKIDHVSLEHKDYEYKCCLGEKWPNTEYSVVLRRNPHKYNILIIMSICITLSALSINTIKMYKYTRTYILVFIPLTLIWLQIHISSKIPVIKEETLLERVVMTCFLTTIISTFQSGILYCFITNYYKILSRYFVSSPDDTVNMGSQFGENMVVRCYGAHKQNRDYIRIYDTISRFDLYFRWCISIVFLGVTTYLLLV
jgi:hypothetical protein